MGLLDELAAALDRRGAASEPLIKSFDQILTSAFPGQGLSGDVQVAQLQENMDRLRKSMAAGDAGVNALQLENLDATMTQVLYDEGWMKLFNSIPRVPSKNQLYEFNRKNTYGSTRGIAGFKEGGAPQGSSGTWTRSNATIRYMGEKGGVTHQLSVAGDMGGYAADPVGEENRNATVRLFAKVERALARGRSDIKDVNNNTVNYDGIIPWMSANYATNVIDMAGAAMSYKTLEDAASNLRVNGKLLTFDKLRTFATPTVLQDFARQSLSLQRNTLDGTGNGLLVPGTPFKGYQSQFGFIPMDDSIFLEETENDGPVAVSGDANAPAAPGTTTGAAATDATSTLAAATYYYFASAYNEAGESLTTASSGVPVASGERATVTIARVTGAIGYRLYRSTTNSAATAKWIGTIPQTASGSATFNDTNAQRPGLGTMILFNADPADIAIAQLAPLVKWPLAITSTTIEFLLLLYHTLVIKAPERVLIYKNIGRAS